MRRTIFSASLREGGGPRSGGRSKRVRKQWFALYGVFAFVFLVEAKVSSLLCAFSFRHPCGAGRWGKATAPCSHPGGSRSDSRRQADMESAPTENSKAMGIFSPKQLSHFAVRRNFTPKAHHFPLAENITRRRRISLCDRRGG